MEYYSAVKRMKLTSKWMELKIIILNEATQTQKDKHGMLLIISRY